MLCFFLNLFLSSLNLIALLSSLRFIIIDVVVKSLLTKLSLYIGLFINSSFTNFKFNPFFWKFGIPSDNEDIFNGGLKSKGTFNIDVTEVTASKFNSFEEIVSMFLIVLTENRFSFGV